MGVQSMSRKTSSNEASDTLSLMNILSGRNLLAIICLCNIVLLEILVFNLPFWQTLGAKETTYSVNQRSSFLSIGSGLSKQGNNLVISDTNEAYIDIHSQQRISYIQLQSQDDQNVKNIVYTVCIQFDAGEQWHDGASRTFSPAIKRSQYVNIGGTTSAIRLRFTAEKGTVIPITGITVNPRIPFHTSSIRLLLELFLALFIIFMGPKSPLYTYGYLQHRSNNNEAYSVASPSSF